MSSIDVLERPDTITAPEITSDWETEVTDLLYLEQMFNRDLACDVADCRKPNVTCHLRLLCCGATVVLCPGCKIDYQDFINKCLDADVPLHCRTCNSPNDTNFVFLPI